MITLTGVRANLEAELAVIGAVLVQPDRIMPECVSLLDEDDFITAECRNIYSACLDFFTWGNHPIDAVTLLARLGSDYKPLLAQAISGVPSVANWRQYAGLVKQTATRFKAFECGTALLEGIRDGEELETCGEQAAKLCDTLSQTQKSNAVVPMQGLKDFAVRAQSPRQYFATGFASLDRGIYVDRGDYVVVGGRPSSGKTAFTLQMMLYMARQHKVAYFSLETSAGKIYDRLASSYFEIQMGEIKRGEVADWSQLAPRSKAFCALNFHVVEAAGWSVAQIQSKAVQLGVEIVFIDYLGLISSREKGRYEKITDISVALHTMAQSRKIAVIALSQLSREKDQSEPDATSLRESGQIEQDSDAVLLLHNMGSEHGGDRKLIIAKNKEGTTGCLRFAFDGRYQRFTEIEVKRGP